MDAFFSEFSRLGRRMFVLGPDAISISGRRAYSRFDVIVNLSDVVSVRPLKVRLMKPMRNLGFVAVLCFAGFQKVRAIGEFYTGIAIWLFIFGLMFAYLALRLLPAFQVTAFFDRRGNVLFDLVKTNAQ